MLNRFRSKTGHQYQFSVGEIKTMLEEGYTFFVSQCISLDVFTIGNYLYKSTDEVIMKQLDDDVLEDFIESFLHTDEKVSATLYNKKTVVIESVMDDIEVE